MKVRRAHPNKSKKIKAERGFAPEEIVENGELLVVLENKNYPEQQIEHYWFDNYGWSVVVNKTDGRLITAYRNRKIKKGEN